ncbi:MAG TPA: hypothetical protein VMT74_08305 [Gaiellaceae bacterium]|nr:hypothetical protein [Gaiellaceae bacterium]
MSLVAKHETLDLTVAERGDPVGNALPALVLCCTCSSCSSKSSED